ncbi:MAG: hypothetical protein IT508_11565, partial [Burkholderiaceae bacterium]|nr:hypothetical protein [Burkholderiaceae bacterium]
RLAHIVQPDINQCGGFLEAKKICATAETYSILAAPHNVGGVITTVASLHLLVGLRNAKTLEHFNDFADAHVKKCGSPYPEVVDGYFQLPPGPGWGIDLDEDFCRQHLAKTQDGVIVDPGLNMFKNANWNQRSQAGK